MNTKKTTEKKLIKRNRKKKIIYPFFTEAGNYIEDEFWKSFFEKLAYNILPSFFKINNNFLSYNRKKISGEYNLNKLIDSLEEEVNKSEIYNLINFFQRYGNIYSDNDLIKIKECIANKKNSQEFIWNKCTRSLKLDLLNLFLEKERIEKDLNKEEFFYLKILILRAFYEKEITGKDLIIKERRIEKIKRLEWIEEERVYEFRFREEEIKKDKSKKEDTEKDIFFAKWKEFLNSILEKNNKEKEKNTSFITTFEETSTNQET